MKRLILVLLLAGFAGTASAQANVLITGFNNVDDALNVLVSGNVDAAIALTQGNVTEFFRNGNHAFQGFATKLASGTPAEPLAEIYVDLTNTGFDTLLPVYQALDGPAMQLAEAGAPLTEPLRAAFQAFDFNLVLDFDESGLPLLGGGLLGGEGLSLTELPLPLGDFDLATLTGLLGGLPLEGLGA